MGVGCKLIISALRILLFISLFFFSLQLMNGFGCNNPCPSGSWQQSQQQQQQQQQATAQLLAQQFQQLQMSTQQPMDNAFSTSSAGGIPESVGGGFTKDLSQAGEPTNVPSADAASGVLIRDDRSPKSWVQQQSTGNEPFFSIQWLILEANSPRLL